MDTMGDPMTGTAAAGNFRGCWSFGEAAASPTKRVECPLGSNSVHLTEDALLYPRDLPRRPLQRVSSAE